MCLVLILPRQVRRGTPRKNYVDNPGVGQGGIFHRSCVSCISLMKAVCLAFCLGFRLPFGALANVDLSEPHCENRRGVRASVDQVNSCRPETCRNSCFRNAIFLNRSWQFLIGPSGCDSWTMLAGRIRRCGPELRRNWNERISRHSRAPSRTVNCRTVRQSQVGALVVWLFRTVGSMTSKLARIALASGLAKVVLVSCMWRNSWSRCAAKWP